MSRGTQHVVVLLLGLATAVMVVKGTYVNYVRPQLLPYLAATAAVLVVLGVAALVRDMRQTGRGDDQRGHEHGHQHHARLTWLLLVPIAMVAFVVPPPLNASGASQPAAISAPQRRPFPPLPPGLAPLASLPDVVMRAAADSTNSLAGRQITMTGFTLRSPGGLDLGRVVIVCCAADAQLARVHLAGPAAQTGYPEDTWLQVQGEIVAGSSRAADNFIPTMAVTHATRIDKPANTYAY